MYAYLCVCGDISDDTFNIDIWADVGVERGKGMVDDGGGGSAGG